MLGQPLKQDTAASVSNISQRLSTPFDVTRLQLLEIMKLISITESSAEQQQRKQDLKFEAYKLYIQQTRNKKIQVFPLSSSLSCS